MPNDYSIYDGPNYPASSTPHTPPTVTASAPWDGRYPEGPWDQWSNVEKFEWICRRLSELQTMASNDAESLAVIRKSLRDHRHAPDGTVMVQYQ